MSARAQARQSETMCERAMAALADAKGADCVCLPVYRLTDVTDYMIICSGTSERHMRTLTDRLLEWMRDSGWPAYGVEGDTAREWILVDFVDLVVHIMRPETREFYQLESLWNEQLADTTPPA